MEAKNCLILLPLYTPSNGSEGDWFEGRWCENCKRGQESEENPEGCLIQLGKRLWGGEGVENGEPTEWVTIPGGISICTAFDPISDEGARLVAERVWTTSAYQASKPA
jgi:hypothetical protein